MEQNARQTIMGGEYTRQQNENQRQLNLMELKSGRQQAKREFRTSMQGANQQMLGGVGDIVGAGLQGFASGGGFSKDGFKMDTFLGRDSVNTFGDVTEILSDGSKSITGAGGPVGDVEKAKSVFDGMQAVSPSSSIDSQKNMQQRANQLPSDPNDPYYQSDEYFNSLDQGIIPVNMSGKY